MVPQPIKHGYPTVKTRLPPVVVNRIREMLLAGTRHLTQVARACNVTTDSVKRLVEQDPELKALHDAAYEEKMEQVEDAMFEQAINGDNEIAKEKAQEYLLRFRRPKVYSPELSDAAAMGGQQTRRIIIAPILPVCQVDKDGIPIKPQEQQEPIDV